MPPKKKVDKDNEPKGKGKQKGGDAAAVPKRRGGRRSSKKVKTPTPPSSSSEDETGVNAAIIGNRVSEALADAMRNQDIQDLQSIHGDDDATVTRQIQEIIMDEAADQFSEHMKKVAGEQGGPQENPHEEQHEDSGSGGQSEAGDDDEEQQAPGKKRRRVVKHKLDLDDNQKNDLADWYQANACFYNKRDPNYRKPPFKERLVIDKAAELTMELGKDITYEQIWSWFKDMRTQFVRNNKPPKSGSAARESHGRDLVMKRFGFLKSHVTIFAQRSTMGLAPPEGTLDEEDEGAAEEEEAAAVEDEGDVSGGLSPTAETQAAAPTADTSTAPPRGLARVRGGGSRQPSRRAARAHPVAGSMQDKLEAAILQIATSQETLGDMRRQVDRVVEASHSMLEKSQDIRHTWTQWMGANATLIHSTLWREFEHASYLLVTEFCRRSTALEHPAAGSSTTTSTTVRDGQQPGCSTHTPAAPARPQPQVVQQESTAPPPPPPQLCTNTTWVRPVGTAATAL